MLWLPLKTLFKLFNHLLIGIMKQKITTQGIAGHESITWTKICVKGGTEESAEIPQFVSTLGLGLPIDTYQSDV